MKREINCFLLMVAFTMVACAHTQSQPTSNCEASPEPARATSDEDDEFGIKKAGDGVPCEQNFDAQTCADLRGVKTKGP